MSTELELIRELYAFISKARAKYLRAIWKLPPRERYRDRGASFPSIVDIYMHVLDAYRYWFMSGVSNRSGIEEYPLGRRYTCAQAIRETQAVDRHLRHILRPLKPADLVKRPRLPPGGSSRATLRQVLLHMVEEELQHRGEMNALLWQIDRDPPISYF